MFRNLFKSLFTDQRTEVQKEITVKLATDSTGKTTKIWKQDKPVCPHCSYDLIDWPERKKKCPACKEDIFIKKDPQDNKWAIINQQTLAIWEAKWQEIFFENRWLRILEQFEITRIDLERLKKESKLSVRDCIWSLFNNALTKYAGDFHKSGTIYFQMAYFVLEEGKDPTYLVQLCREMDIQRIEESIEQTGFLPSKVQIHTKMHESANCTNCSFLDGKILDINDARTSQPIPHKDCNRQFCLAYYGPVSNRR